MPAFVQSLGGAYTSASSSQSFITTSATASVGNTIIVACKGSAFFKATGVVDTRGNTYSQDEFNEDTGNTITVFSAPVTTALQTGDVITITFEGGSLSHTCWALEYSGILLASPIDVSADAGASATTLTSGPINTTNPNDIIISAHSLNNTDAFTATPSSHTVRVNFSNGGVRLGMSDYVPGATGSYSATWTIGASARNMANAIIAYKPLQYTLGVQSSKSAGQTDDISLTQAYTIAGQSAESASEITGIGLAQNYTLNVQSAESAGEVSNTALTTASIIGLQSLISGSETSNPSLIQRHSLGAESAESASDIDRIDIEQNQALFIQSPESLSETQEAQLVQSSLLAIESVVSSAHSTKVKLNREADARDYYIDSQGNVYWVVDQDIGLVERI